LKNKSREKKEAPEPTSTQNTNLQAAEKGHLNFQHKNNNINNSKTAPFLKRIVQKNQENSPLKELLRICNVLFVLCVNNLIMFIFLMFTSLPLSLLHLFFKKQNPSQIF